MKQTNSPDKNCKNGRSFSGNMKLEAKRVTNPRAKTLDVWVNVTVNPSIKACFIVPLEPTK